MRTAANRRVLTGAAALAIAFATPLTLPGVAAPAIAQSAGTTSLDSVIDTSKTGSITVHKYEGVGTDQIPANGLPVSPEPTNKAVEGVKFSLQRIDGLSVTSIADWKKVEGLNNDASKASTLGTLVDAGTLTTGSDGKATLGNLPLGFYVLTETSAPAGYVTSGPWIIALPMTSQWTSGNDTSAGSAASTGAQWNYDVNVYPKNEKPTVDKTVDDTKQNVGGKVTYSIDAAIPTGGDITSLIISDLLDARLETTLDDVKIFLVNKDGTETAANSAWFTKTVGTDKRKVVVTANETGRTQLKKAVEDGTAEKVRVKIGANVKESGNGEIPNKANVYYNNPDSNGVTENGPDNPPPNNPPNETPEVKTYEAKVKITKKDAKTAGLLKGAEFQVYECTSNSEVKAFQDQNGKPGTVTGSALTIKGQDKWTTGDNGVAEIDAIHVQDFVNNKTVTPSVENKLLGNNAQGFCLVETKAPAGKELQPTPIFFQLAKADAENQNTKLFNLDVEDPDENAGFHLPLTGGRALLIFGGLAILSALAAGYFAVRGRKEEA